MRPACCRMHLARAALAGVALDLLRLQQLLGPCGPQRAALRHHTAAAHEGLKQAAAQRQGLHAQLRLKRGVVPGLRHHQHLHVTHHVPKHDNLGVVGQALAAHIGHELLQLGHLACQLHARHQVLVERVHKLLTLHVTQQAKHQDLVEGPVHEGLAEVVITLKEAAPLPDGQLLGGLLRLNIRGNRVNLDVHKHNLLGACGGTQAAGGLSLPELLGQWELSTRDGILDGCRGRHLEPPLAD
mmetsp:Transcript_12819/g.27715  ORF Transcript_12819/g.27715 Transcript_12819/m.27715 type:complete len:241 (+) Transcript_12819:330-1052(+)